MVGSSTAFIAVNDGSHSLSTFDFNSTFDAIIAHGWAPQMAIDHYSITAGNPQMNTGTAGYKQVDIARRQIVENFFAMMSEWRHSHQVEDRYIAVQRAYDRLTKENASNAISDFTRSKTARAWAYVTTDSSLRSLLVLSLENFNQTDTALGGLTGKQYINARLTEMINGTGDAASVLSTACSNNFILDYKPTMLDSGGRTAVTTFLTEIDPPGALNNFKYTLKSGSSSTARDLVANFLTAAGPLLNGCSKYLSAQWLHTVTNVGTTTQRDTAAATVIANIAHSVDGARADYTFAQVKLKDPNNDGFSFTSNGGNYTSTAQVNADITALGDQIGDVFTIEPHMIGFHCADVVRLGGTPAACSSYFGTPLSSKTPTERLFDLQNLFAELEVWAAYEFEPAFQSKLDAIYSHSGCLPTAWLGWTPRGSGASLSYDVTVEAPASQLFDAPVNTVPDRNELVLVADGSRLQSDTFWDKDSNTTRPCARGDVKIFSHLKFDSSHNLTAGLFRDGYKDTCVPGGEFQADDWTTMSYVDLEIIN